MRDSTSNGPVRSIWSSPSKSSEPIVRWVLDGITGASLLRWLDREGRAAGSGAHANLPSFPAKFVPGERGEESGFSDDEIAFYDALADNQSARDLMGEPALRVIAHELVQDIRKNISVDWAHRESARADIRRRVKRILRRYDYPPDLQDAAVQNVLQQAEALSAEMAWPN